ncbi:MAG: IS4 family transposase [Planctomycetota bacterium]
MIGRLGGHLGRKCDEEPGVRSLWKGWRDLQLLVRQHCLLRAHGPPP